MGIERTIAALGVLAAGFLIVFAPTGLAKAQAPQARPRRIETRLPASAARSR